MRTCFRDDECLRRLCCSLSTTDEDVVVVVVVVVVDVWIWFCSFGDDKLHGSSDECEW